MASRFSVRKAEPRAVDGTRLPSTPSPPPLGKLPSAREVRLQKFHEIHGPTAQSLQQQTENFAKMVGKRKKTYVLHPEKTRILGEWDIVTSVALIYTATLTPYETAFMAPVLGPEAWGDPWFIVNRCLDGIFGLDMILQFFIAYTTGNDFAGRVWVEDHRSVRTSHAPPLQLPTSHGLDAHLRP